jgi:hypothetical protein
MFSQKCTSVPQNLLRNCRSDKADGSPAVGHYKNFLRLVTFTSFARDETHLSNKSTLEKTVSNVTGISLDVLRGRPLAQCTIEERLAWAKTRMNMREEDHVHSLFGLFDVSMPLIYRKGRVKAL